MLKSYPEPARERRLAFANKHDIDTACWADLVSWSYGSREFEDCFCQGCRPDRVPYAYCGKCDHYFNEEAAQ